MATQTSDRRGAAGPRVDVDAAIVRRSDPAPATAAAQPAANPLLTAPGAARLLPMAAIPDASRDHVVLDGLAPIETLRGEAPPDEAKSAAPGSPNRAELPRQVMAQLAEIARRLPDGPVEVSLSPEELGKVRLSLNGAESVMVVQIVAERSETLDLIRRNLDILAEELRGLGYAEMRFALGDGGAGTGARDSGGQANAQDAISGDPAPDIAPVPAAVELVQQTGLDLRL